MQLAEIHNWDLQKQKLSEGVFIKLIEQLVKDIGEESYYFPLLDLHVNEQDRIVSIVKQLFLALFDQDLERFSQVLYLVDLPEKITKKVFSTASEMDWDLFANQIVRRELLKVVLRAHYSNNNELDS